MNPPRRESPSSQGTAPNADDPGGSVLAPRATAAARLASAATANGVHKAIQVHDSYLVAETGDGMMVIDQHALHERILYEELRSRVARGTVEAQRLLAPEPVDLSGAEVALLTEHTELLAQLGLEVEHFGGDTVIVRSIPAMLPHVVPDRLVRDLAEHLRTQPLPPTRDNLLAELLHMIACKAAVKAGQPLSPPEIAALLERRHLVADSHHCPHGRPTALVFTKADLEKQFGAPETRRTKKNAAGPMRRHRPGGVRIDPSKQSASALFMMRRGGGVVEHKRLDRQIVGA